MSKQAYDPFTILSQPLLCLKTESCIGQKNIYNHVPEYLSWTPTPIFEKDLNLRKCCHSLITFPPSTSATKPQTGPGNNGMAMAWEAFWLALLREFLEIFLKGSECMWFPMDFSCQWDNQISVFSPCM